MAILLTGCGTKVIYEINNGCHIFERGFPSSKDTLKTLEWFENHNDIYRIFCEVENENYSI